MKIRQNKLPDIIGITRQAISQAKMQEKIDFDENGFFNTLNKKNKLWLGSKGIDPKTGKQIDIQEEVKELKERYKKSEPGQKKNHKKKEVIRKVNSKSIDRISGSDFSVMTRLPEAMLNMTLRELAIKHGTQQGLKVYVEILDKLMSAARKDVDIQERRKNLLPKSLMQYMFQYLDVFNNQVFDFAKSITAEVISISRADEKKARSKIPEMLTDALSKLAKESRKNIIRELNKYENALEKEVEE